MVSVDSASDVLQEERIRAIAKASYLFLEITFSWNKKMRVVGMENVF